MGLRLNAGRIQSGSVVRSGAAGHRRRFASHGGGTGPAGRMTEFGESRQRLGRSRGSRSSVIRCRLFDRVAYLSKFLLPVSGRDSPLSCSAPPRAEFSPLQLTEQAALIEDVLPITAAVFPDRHRRLRSALDGEAADRWRRRRAREESDHLRGQGGHVLGEVVQEPIRLTESARFRRADGSSPKPGLRARGRYPRQKFSIDAKPGCFQHAASGGECLAPNHCERGRRRKAAGEPLDAASDPFNRLRLA